MKRYAFSTGALYPLSSEDALLAIRKAGFSCAELMPQAFSNVSDSFAKIALRTGVHVTSIHYPLAMFGMLYTAQADMDKDSRQFSKDLVRMAKILGALVVVIHPHKITDPKYFSLLEEPVINGIKHLAELCRENDITLAMENHPKSMGATAQGLLCYTAKYFYDCPSIKPMVDTTEVCEVSQDPAEFIKIVKPIHLHLSDFSGNIKHLPAGEGDIRWDEVTKSISTFSYEGVYTLEPSYRFYLDDIDKKLKKAYEFVTNQF